MWNKFSKCKSCYRPHSHRSLPNSHQQQKGSCWPSSHQYGSTNKNSNKSRKKKSSSKKSNWCWIAFMLLIHSSLSTFTKAMDLSVITPSKPSKMLVMSSSLCPWNFTSQDCVTLLFIIYVPQPNCWLHVTLSEAFVWFFAYGHLWLPVNHPYIFIIFAVMSSICLLDWFYPKDCKINQH